MTGFDAFLDKMRVNRADHLHSCFNALTIWVVFFLCLIGCTSNETPQIETKNNTIKSGDSRPVVCRLKWLYNTSVAGEIWAQESGIFKAHGLTVKLREGGPEQDAIKDLELGRALWSSLGRSGDPGYRQGSRCGGTRPDIPGQSPSVDLCQRQAGHSKTSGPERSLCRRHIRR